MPDVQEAASAETEVSTRHLGRCATTTRPEYEMPLTIRQMFLFAAILVTAFGAVAALGAGMALRSGMAAEEASRQRLTSYLLADELRQSSDDLTRLARTFVVSDGDPKWERQYFEVLDIRNGKRSRPQDYERIYWDFRAADQEQVRSEGAAVPLLELMQRAGFSPAEFAKLEQAKANSDGLVQTETVAMNLVKGLTADGRKADPSQLSANRAQARAMMHDLEYHRNKAKIMKPVDEFLAMLDARTQAAVDGAVRQERLWSALTMAFIMLATAVTVLALFVIGRRVRATLNELGTSARGIADGRLDVAVPTHRRGDEGRTLNELDIMRARLADVIQSIRSSADSVATASIQIAQGNSDLSSRTELQAGALQATASSMEQLDSTVKLNASSADQASRLAAEASQVAGRGGEVVGQVIDTMKDINAGSARIRDIVGVIDSIAFQTNILALNAAVEAARAGEQGRGFAVVAGEVRTLSQRSAEAAKEIKALIATSVERVEDGARLADRAGATMTEVVGAIQRVNVLAQEIASASAEQSAGVAQVSCAMSEMDQSTQQNAALVEESAAAAESLRSQAAQLVQTVAAFSLPGAAAA
jgi:methyl-accepting chemotaxis protein